MMNILFLASFLAFALIHGGCGYTQLRRTEPVLPPPSDPLEVSPMYDPIGFYADTGDIPEPYMVIDTLASSEVGAGPWDEERLLEAVVKEAQTSGADAVVNLRSELQDRSDVKVRHPPDLFRVARGRLIKYFRTFLRPMEPFLRFRMPGELYYTIEVEDIDGDSIDRTEHRLGTSYELRVDDLPAGIYRVTFLAESRGDPVNRDISWTTHWIVTRWLLIERKAPGI